jgi:hypothetical protein
MANGPERANTTSLLKKHHTKVPSKTVSSSKARSSTRKAFTLDKSRTGKNTDRVILKCQLTKDITLEPGTKTKRRASALCSKITTSKESNTQTEFLKIPSRLHVPQESSKSILKTQVMVNRSDLITFCV